MPRHRWLTALSCALLLGCSGAVSSEGSAEPDGGGVSPGGTTESSDVNSGGPQSPGTGGSSDPSLSATSSTDGSEAPPVSTENPAPQAPTGNLLRLTQVELNHALRDLLGDEANAASSFLSEDEFSPFDNDASRQLVSPSLLESVHALAQDVASRLATDPVARAAWMPCEPTSAGDAACFDATATKLARLFFRREIEPGEVSGYRPLLDFAREANDFNFGLELLLSALIQDPEFLYRLERPVSGELSGAEIATRLAFLLWGSVPDDALLNQASAGALSTAEGRKLAATQMLESPASKQQLFRFHSMWLGYRAIPHDAELNAAFQLETEKLIERVVFEEPQNYLRLFTSEQTYLTPSLAEHYGLPAPSESGGWVTYPTLSGRAGILSHGSVLSAFSKFDDTSPTQRGIFIRTRLLCQAVPPPPPAVNIDNPPGGSEAQGACKTERYRAHREQSGCMECHALFEPIGEGLERFDRAGRYREHDDADESCAIAGQGELPGIGAFEGPAELAALLTQEDSIQTCLVRHLVRYARGTNDLSPDDEIFVSDMASAFNNTELLLTTWLPEWVSDERFVRPLEETP